MKLPPIRKQKKGVLEGFNSLVIGVAIFILTLVLVFVLLARTAANTTVAANTNATAAIAAAENDLDDLPGWVGLVIIAFVFVAILGLVMLLKRRT